MGDERGDPYLQRDIVFGRPKKFAKLAANANASNSEAHLRDRSNNQRRDF